MSIIPTNKTYDRRLLNTFLTILYGKNNLSTVVRFKEHLGIDKVDNVRDIDKPVSSAVAQSILNARVNNPGITFPSRASAYFEMKSSISNRLSVSIRSLSVRQ